MKLSPRFVSMASHEFRTPLSSILSSVSLVEKYTDAQPDDKRIKHFDRIKSGVKNLTDILGDFLSLDKLEQGKIEFRLETISLIEFSKIVKDGLAGMRKKGQVIKSTHKGKDKVASDGKILGNILTNLLSNAIKYSNEGEILLTTEVDEHGMVITVKDAGMGIPEEDQKHLFKMFHRAKNADSIQGTGLGLNIVKRYVELLNGTISFTSKLNEGTTFRMEFPLLLVKRIEPPKNTELYETHISTHWFDEDGIFYSISKNVEREIKHYKEVMAVYSRFSKDGKLCLLSDVSNSVPMSPDALEYFTTEFPKYVKAQAIISDSPIGGTFGKTYQILSDKGFSTKQFSTVEDAKSWLKEFL